VASPALPSRDDFIKRRDSEVLLKSLGAAFGVFLSPGLVRDPRFVDEIQLAGSEGLTAITQSNCCRTPEILRTRECTSPGQMSGSTDRWSSSRSFPRSGRNRNRPHDPIQQPRRRCPSGAIRLGRRRRTPRFLRSQVGVERDGGFALTFGHVTVRDHRKTKGTSVEPDETDRRVFLTFCYASEMRRHGIAG